MLPAEIFSGCPSPGERDVFYRLKGSPGIDDWIVLHSLDIAQHVRQVSGEADFVVIIPGMGVLCLEVKACHEVVRDSRGWHYGMSYKPDVRGPFRQASDAMHSIRIRLASSRPRLSRVVFWSAVVFTHLAFKIRSDEWHEWQVIDIQSLRSSSLPECLLRILSRGRELLSEKHPAWFDKDDPGPSVEDCREIAECLRPSFELYASPRSQALQIQSEVKRYTDEQFGALDSMAPYNPRVVYRGPAGTGKTLLAIECARRAASSGSRHVLLLCFNKLLGRWLADQTRPLPSVRTMTLHSFLLRICPTAVQGDASMFWESTLPDRALERILHGTFEEQFDELVIDEAQDVLRPQYLDVLDFCLKGGVAAGQWRFFGDFEKQNLFGPAEDPLSVLRSRSPHFSEYGLRDNCRNPPRIACLVHLLGRLSPDYRRILRPDSGIEPDLLFYRTREEQVSLLVRQLEELYRSGLKGSQIVVLSCRADATSVVSSVNMHPWRERLAPYGSTDVGQIGYSSIHAFKGLEAEAVIVTDLEALETNAAGDLFYVGITRALHRLAILANESLKAEITTALLNPKKVTCRTT